LRFRETAEGALIKQLTWMRGDVDSGRVESNRQQSNRRHRHGANRGDCGPWD
jgi:hypothetical protein